MTTLIYNTDCVSCLQAVYPENTQYAIPVDNQLILECGHALHLSCFKNAGKENQINCWICRQPTHITKILEEEEEQPTPEFVKAYKRGMNLGVANVHLVSAGFFLAFVGITYTNSDIYGCLCFAASAILSSQITDEKYIGKIVALSIVLQQFYEPKPVNSLLYGIAAGYSMPKPGKQLRDFTANLFGCAKMVGSLYKSIWM